MWLVTRDGVACIVQFKLKDGLQVLYLLLMRSCYTAWCFCHISHRRLNKTTLFSFALWVFHQGLEAGICFEDGHQRNTAYSIFFVSFTLTEKGMNHWENIIGLFFSLLSLLRKDPLPRWIQDEMHRISYLSFRSWWNNDALPICVATTCVRW